MVEKFEQLVIDAIELNLRHRLKHRDHEAHMSTARFAHEFCTVRVNVGRQVGKTTFITKWAGTEDLVIVHNRQTADHIRHDMRSNVKVVTMSELENEWRFGRLMGIKFLRTIYVDEASFITTKQLDYMYEFISRLMFPPTIVMMG